MKQVQTTFNLQKQKESSGKKLIPAIIKYGVNPNIPDSSESLIPDLYSRIVDSIGESCGIDDTPPGNDSNAITVVGERRRMLSYIFRCRAEYLFGNLITNANRDAKDMLKQISPDIFKAVVNNNYYSPNDDSSNEFKLWSLSFAYNAVPDMTNIIDGVMYRQSSNLCNLEYYMNMPVETVLDELLTQCAAGHSRMMCCFKDIIGNPKYDDVIDVDGIIAFTGDITMRILTAAEQIVYVLYSEAHTQLIPAAYPGLPGLSYDLDQYLYDMSFKNAVIDSGSNTTN